LFAVLVDQANELGSDEHAFAETVEEFRYGLGGVRISRRSIDASAFAHGSLQSDPPSSGTLLLQEKCGIFSCRDRRNGMQQAIEQKILSRIYGNGRGWAFSQADFADLGARSTIDSALHRREREGVIRRVIRGIYHYPRHSKALGGPTSPNIDQIAHALARKFNWRIQPNGATAQNLLGLSTQVPVTPETLEAERRLMDAELVRVNEFANTALNPYDAERAIATIPRHNAS